MKTYLQKPKLRVIASFVLTLAIAVFITSCNDDDDKPKIIPEVTTAAITDFTTTTATGGGTIVSNGNATITASGLVYSNVNTTPTLDDSFTEETATSGTFTSELTGLASGTPYYVRAYATNSVGTGYGDVVPFTTGNAAPTAINITITGTVQVLETLTASYSYSDTEGDAESGTTIQWYVANDGVGSGEEPIEGATELTYKLEPADEFKYIRVGVTVNAATGTTAGAEVKSAFSGPVAEEPSTVTFPYNGQTVTYNIIISATGRRWMDRNLGAPNTPTSYDDWANYGDMFQWGRAADGHQLTTRAATNPATTGSATSTEIATTDNPGHSSFILSPVAAGANSDWSNPQNNNRWQGVDGINNPCPEGWRIPTKDEWLLEEIAGFDDGFGKLKLTFGGQRSASSGSYAQTTSFGIYWSSTISDEGAQTSAVRFILNSSSFTNSLITRATGMSCRCIKD